MKTRSAAARLEGTPTYHLASFTVPVPHEGQQSHATDLPHVRQSFNWDCGLACVLMILRGMGATRCDLPAMRLLCPTTSIWTVDLAHLLCRFGLDVTFCTVTLGANPDFVSEARRATRTHAVV